ncbi:MAG: J domain-containing protein [Desulfobacteraceae bacterium]|jgi:hypothetical protein
MYIARLPQQGGRCKYIIRHSYDDGTCYRSCDLYDLGDDPTRFIVYPGGNSFYIDLDLEEAIAAQGIFVSQELLEPLFLPFLAPHIRRVIAAFDRKSRHHCISTKACIPAESHHPFDRYRLHFLKLGQVDFRTMACTPDHFYISLQHKSRDEIESDFITAERILKTKELSQYTFQIFNLQSYFKESFARGYPMGLDQNRMDRFFMEALCRLNQDEFFWRGSDEEVGLRRHLIRYAIMYFDSVFPSYDPFRDFLRDFANRHRTHRPPESIRVSLAESARLLGVSEKTLKEMDGQTLTRQYRKQALKYHPDKGGRKETFIKLSAAYHKLLKRKSG